MKVKVIQIPLTAAVSMLADLIEDVVDVFGEAVGMKQKPSSKKSKANSVPTADRIKIPNRIVNDCKKAVADKKKEKENMKKKATLKKKACPKCKPVPAKSKAAAKKPAAKKPVPAKKKVAAAPLFSGDEQKKILALRKKGLSIKAIGKAIKRRDKSVSAFLKSAAAKAK